MQGNDISIYVTLIKLRMAAFADNVVPVLSHFSSLTAAFADNLVPVMSLFFTDGGISR